LLVCAGAKNAWSTTASRETHDARIFRSPVVRPRAKYYALKTEGFEYALEPIDANNGNVTHSAILQLRQNMQPKLGPCILLP
jgi:hypothetical protein